MIPVGKTQSTRGKTKLPHGMAWYRTQASPVRDRQLITSPMAWPPHS